MSMNLPTWAYDMRFDNTKIGAKRCDIVKRRSNEAPSYLADVWGRHFIG